jgi:Protein of unknown function (DUF1553)/Protein of unknown function (DUF1549)/Planctomycete cytochrome C
MRISLSALLLCLSPVFVLGDSPVDFSREIKPLLLNSCYACHGPDEGTRKAKLRLDVREEAIRKSIVVGQGAKSPLYLRMVTKEHDEVMPPPMAKKPAVTAAQAERVRKWIDEGAKFDQHWAYVKPTSHPVPAINKPAFPIQNPIDAYVLARLVKEGIAPSPLADKNTLAQRLSFDLTGLPVKPDMAEAFGKDGSPQAYEKLVDQLLASPHFGERMAQMWLDAIRYADTAGYHSDNHRDVWMFRDFTIKAFNSNKPFDRFTIEQLAGDLLPGATTEQKIASGYNRMLMTTEEGGAQAKEYTAKYAADRVRNASNAWLGSTLGCAECHNHKYDPYTTKDFYAFAAFFADVQETPVGRQAQTMMPEPAQEKQLQEIDAALGKAKAEVGAFKPVDEAIAKWEVEAKKDIKKLPKPVQDAINVEAGKRTDAHKKTIANHYRDTAAPETAAARKSVAELTAKRDGVVKAIPTTLISMRTSPRMVRILPRGNWLDDSGEVVKPALPGFLGTIDKKDPATQEATRMDLAAWMVSAENPLTARVFVNRLWKIAFGSGLVRNMEDFGTQGTPPTHPELLDWLALEFVKNGWDTKKTLKTILMSNAYRQSSVSTKAARDKDPGNLWLGRQNRFRLDAEFVRDNALAISGLLNAKIGGPSVKPYQPAGYWSYLNFPTREWQPDRNEEQYRRGLYTYWCRSFLHPSLAAFDAPSREECTNERTRSSTPLQALVLLNDPTYVEAARVFALSIITGPKTTPDRVQLAFRKALARPATADEVQIVTGLYAKHREEFAKDAEGVKKLLSVGLAPIPKETDPVELAAWTSVARVILNLHETVTRD